MPSTKTQPGSEPPKHKRPTRRNATYIVPDCLYTKKQFLADAGLTRNQLNRAGELGVELDTIDVGTRQYVKGAAGIAFIEQYSKAMKRANA